MSKRAKILAAIAVALVLVGILASAVGAQASRTRIAWLIADRLSVVGNASVDGVFTANGYTFLLDDVTSTGDFSTTGLMSNGGILQDINYAENLYMLPTVASASVEYTTTTALFTIADGEVWIVHDVLVNVTDNYDCTGDNCTFQIGDGGDANGLVDLVDAELQAADVEVTGGAAGWQGYLSGTRGAYLANGGGFVYAPSGAAETIDLAIGGTDPADGAATVYIVYTRIE